MSATVDLATIVKAAQERIARIINLGQMRGDPLVDVLETMSLSLGAQLALHEANIVEPAVDAIAIKAEVDRLGRQHGRQVLRSFDQRTVRQHGAMMAGLLALGAVLGGIGVYSVSAGRFELDGAILCRAAGVVVDAKNQRFYPALLPNAAK